MNPALRPLIAQCMIGLAVCAGGYMVFVEPNERELQDVRARLEMAQQDAATRSNTMMTISQADAMRRDVLSTAKAMWKRNQAASSESAIFESIMKLAGETGVRVDSMAPAAMTQGAKPATNAEGKKLDDRRCAFLLNVRCEYHQLASFIDQIQNHLGYADVRSVRISPINEPGSRLVNAQIETEHVVFDLSAIKPLADAQEKTP